jgi:hypothetical protein
VLQLPSSQSRFFILSQAEWQPLRDKSMGSHAHSWPHQPIQAIQKSLAQTLLEREAIASCGGLAHVVEFCSMRARAARNRLSWQRLPEKLILVCTPAMKGSGLGDGQYRDAVFAERFIRSAKGFLFGPQRK